MLLSLYSFCIMPTCVIGVTIHDILVSGGTAFSDVGTMIFFFLNAILAPERCDGGGINTSVF